jgi:hypothetical protein
MFKMVCQTTRSGVGFTRFDTDAPDARSVEAYQKVCRFDPSFHLLPPNGSANVTASKKIGGGGALYCGHQRVAAWQLA